MGNNNIRPRHTTLTYLDLDYYSGYHKNRIYDCFSLPADVLGGSLVTHSFLPHGRDERTPKDVCGEATIVCYYTLGTLSNDNDDEQQQRQ